MGLKIHSIISDNNLLLALEPEELASILLQWINALPQNDKYQIKPKILFGEYSDIFMYGHHQVEIIKKALMEAWVCLVRDGFVTPLPDNDHGCYFITRRGQKVTKASDMDTYRKANLLPKQLLHSKLALTVWPAFARGEYDTAVFQAFKQVEVAVRDAGGFDADKVGVHRACSIQNQRWPINGY